MKKNKELQKLANNVANVTLQIMYENTDWMLSGYEQDESQNYNDIHAYVMQEAITIMYKQSKQ